MRENFEGYHEMSDLLSDWNIDPNGNKEVFIALKEQVMSKDNILISFKARPGVSYSLRGSLMGSDRTESRLFVLIDIIDDDPDERWLSVCFYGDSITDDNGLGDLIPGGLLGEDGYCFDIYEIEESAISYLKGRIDEAYVKTLASFD